MHAETALFSRINHENAKCEHVRRRDEILLQHFEKLNSVFSTGLIIPKNWMKFFAPVNLVSSSEF